MKTTTRWIAGLALAFMAPGLAWGCSVSTVGLAFGSYSLFDLAPNDSTGEIVVNCETAYSIRLDEGSFGHFSERAMGGDAGVNDRLFYNLFTAPNYSIVWGDGTGGTSTVSDSGASIPTHHYVYGRIPAAQNARVGGYSDQIIVTLEF